MQYFIAHFLEEKATEYVRQLQTDLSKRFDIPILHENASPNITLKAPFETDSIENIIAVTKTFVSGEIPSRFALSGFCYIDDRAVCLYVDPSARLIETIDSYLRLLRSLPEVTFADSETDLPTLHSTVAEGDIQNRFSEIQEYCNSLPKPQYDLQFDSISLQKFEDNTWQPECKFGIKKKAI